jgi:hypothetical protein
VVLKLPSTAHLPPQQTFSIRGMGSGGQVLAAIKGSVVVTSVLNDRLARARVTDVHDRRNDPILRGDKIFSFGWNPNMRQHVAIAGAIDLNAGSAEGLSPALKNPSEAQRRLLEFKRSLETQGMVVDAYIDLVNPKIQGEVTLDTDYLIVGDVPPGLSEGKLIKDKEKDEQMKETVADLLARMTQDAASKGVTIVPIRKFVVLTGFRPPRTGGGIESATYEPKPRLPVLSSPTDRKPAPKPDSDRPAEAEADKAKEAEKPEKPQK